MSNFSSGVTPVCIKNNLSFHPAKQVTVTFKASAEAGNVDAVVKVKNSPTTLFYAGFSVRGFSG